MKYFLDALKYKYANFNGRARRTEYWMFMLFAFILVPIALQLVIGLPAALFHLYFLPVAAVVIYYLGIIVPTLAISVRRMHDVDKDWWYMLIPIYGLILRATEGTRGPNQYGPDPKASEAGSSTAFGTFPGASNQPSTY